MLTPANIFATKVCDGSEMSTKEFEIEEEVQYASDSVWAFAYSIKAMHEDLCAGVPGVCSMMKPVNGTTLLSYLKKASFNGITGKNFKFNTNGYGPAQFEILQAKQETPGKYKWLYVDNFKKRALNSLYEDFCYQKNKHSHNVCNVPCKEGQMKKYDDIKCCWQCISCQKLQIVENETACVNCPFGYFPKGNYTHCEFNSFVYFYTVPKFPIMPILAIGMFLTTIVLMILVCFRDTPVMKAARASLGHALFGSFFESTEEDIFPIVLVKKTKIKEIITFEDYNYEPKYERLVKSSNYSVSWEGGIC
ncbi:hypothetical protein TNIN_265301 [Trichonephila inaurata madagascariensis]|uniref:Receptor ligand binding region domain-containing protein n=1 Tax=Trichonephila inaurata madagascariensis TaxID=2747483 RepID=A0A8X6XKR8_9ARAC|nr:hypothetical protein TNIN_265301 [Trichonephila inaurata madagascariensis]